ncbi:MAG TPA: hypothetical protein VHX87_03190 [Galbitalea sp.]|jgi:hypothetical protein|nr:hypothetical protein [Galbitalea sp.]
MSDADIVIPGACTNQLHEVWAALGTEFNTTVSFTSDAVTWYWRSCPGSTPGYSIAEPAATDEFDPNPSWAACNTAAAGRTPATFASPTRDTDTGSDPVVFAVKSAPEPVDEAKVGLNGLLGTEKPGDSRFETIDVDAGAHEPFGSCTFTGDGETSFVSDPSGFLNIVSSGPYPTGLEVAGLNDEVDGGVGRTGAGSGATGAEDGATGGIVGDVVPLAKVGETTPSTRAAETANEMGRLRRNNDTADSNRETEVLGNNS